MNRLFIKKLITSIIFLIILLFFCIQNILTSWEPLKNQFVKSNKKILESENDVSKRSLLSRVDYIKDKIALLDTAINENTYERYKFIEAYGYLQKLMGKNEEGNFEVVKDYDNILHYTYFTSGPKNTEEFAVKTKIFKDKIKNQNTKIIYLMTPDKYIQGKTKLENGLPYNYANEAADKYIGFLKDKNIDYIDLRENIVQRNLEPEELFFKTDHHWNIQTAFDQYKQLINILNTTYEMNVDEDGFYRNSDNYNYITYKNSYIGSMGRKCGKYYDGIDDFTLVFPKFETSYSFYSRTNEYEIDTEGRFEEALLSVHTLNNDKSEYSLDSDKYSTYLFGNQGEVHITNNNNKNGLKVLFIKDSFAVPLSAFFSNVCSDTYLIDPRYYDKNLVDFANSKEFDIIFVSFTPQSISEEFFNF